MQYKMGKEGNGDGRGRRGAIGTKQILWYKVPMLKTWDDWGWRDKRAGKPFEDWYVPEPMSGCWIWIGYTDDWGYGVFRGKRAHRVAHELHIGPIPIGQKVCHKCDNKTCVNPIHLYAGTQADNMRDFSFRGNHSHGGKSPILARRARVAAILQEINASQSCVYSKNRRL